MGVSSKVSFVVPRYMNTYRLEPKKYFSRDQVYKIIEEIVNKECTGLQYDPVKCPNLAINIASQIRLKVKELEFDRYKYIVFVEIGEKKLHGFESAVKFLWDASKDGFANFFFDSTTMFVSATCFGVYRE